MIKIYRSDNFFSKSETIIDCDGFFRNHINSLSLSNEALEAMKIIDNATLIDRDIGTIQTPFGICNIDDMSTGCKTVITVLYLHANKDRYSNIKAVNATECGTNGLDLMFEYIDKLGIGISIIIKHQDIFKCKDRDYLIDGKHKVKSLLTMEEIE